MNARPKRNAASTTPIVWGLSRKHIFDSVEDEPEAPADRLHRSLSSARLRSGDSARRNAWRARRSRALRQGAVYRPLQFRGVADREVTGGVRQNALARFDSLQMYYSIAGRDLEREIVPLAKDAQLAILPWSPLAGGFLSGKYTRAGAPTDGARRLAFDFPPVDKEKAYDIIDVMKEIGDARGSPSRRSRSHGCCTKSTSPASSSAPRPSNSSATISRRRASSCRAMI